MGRYTSTSEAARPFAQTTANGPDTQFDPLRRRPMQRCLGKCALGVRSPLSSRTPSPPSLFVASRCLARHCAMSAAATKMASQAGSSQPAEVKILMLHGYTQSGPLFHAKTRALEKLLAKTLAPVPLVPILVYPTGPNRLHPRDIPGYQPPAPPPGQQAAGDDEGDYQPDTWAWFRKDEATGTYRLLAEGMATIAGAIREAGGVDAVCGFSQGGAVAAVVAAALEPERPVSEGPDGSWALALRDANGGRPLKFAVSYSGFFGPVDALKWCYEPKLKTPTLHYIGCLDTVVDESRSQALIDRCQDPVVVVHPGGHHVPVAKEWVMPLAGFIMQHVQEAQPKPGL